MDIQENWLANFKAVVSAEIKAAGGKEAAGYRAVAAKTGLGYDYIYQIYKDKPAQKPKRPSAEAMNTINRVYGEDREKNWINQPVREIDLSERMVGKANRPNIEATTPGDVPVVSWVQAGDWCGIVDNFQPGDAEDWLPCPVRHGRRTYALVVRGLSMYDPTGRHSFRDGDTIFVDPDRGADHRSLVIARLDDEKEATFKQLLIEGDQRMLQALNPSWPNRIIPINGNCTMCGVVIGKLESFI